MEQGQTGLSVAYDLPTLMGYDADSPLSEGEVGKCGVAVSSLADMEVLFDGIPLEKVTVSQTINAPASVLLAMYLVVAEKQGADWDKISGTLQNDILKEYIAQKEWIYPIKPAMKLVIDTFEFCTNHVPRYNPISVSGYHIREAGATAGTGARVHLARRYRIRGVGRRGGLEVDRFVPRISFFFNAHNDFFEEIAKYRAARRIWAREMKNRVRQISRAHVAAALPHSNGRCFVDSPTTAEQHRSRGDPGAGGSARRNAESAHRCLRRSTGAADRSRGTDRASHAADHRRGNRRCEHGRSARRLLLSRGADAEDGRRGARLFPEDRCDGRHGRAIEKGFPQREIQDSAYQYQKAVERGEQVIVGVNKYEMTDEPSEMPILVIDESVRTHQIERLEQTRLAA